MGWPKAMRLFNQFYAYVVIHGALSKRVVMEGFSRGGLYAFNFAATHPTSVAALFTKTTVRPPQNLDFKFIFLTDGYGVREENTGAVIVLSG